MLDELTMDELIMERKRWAQLAAVCKEHGETSGVTTAEALVRAIDAEIAARG